MESKEIAVPPSQDVYLPQISRSLPSEHEMMVFTTISKQAADSNMYRNYGGQAGIMMTILAARELGIPPMLALNGGISNIQGKLEISARLMNAMMRRAGIKITIKECNDDCCVLVGSRHSGDSATVSYTFAEAQKAGLVKPSSGWVKNPKDMCFARAISRLARQIAPDIIGGCYVEGEIRPTDNEISVPKDIPMDESYVTPEENMAKLLALIPQEDHDLMMEYIDVVMRHFNWQSKEKTVEKFLEEKEIIVKFNSWKSKRKTLSSC